MYDKYIMYLRKSRADREAELHGEGETLARHEKLLTDYAIKNKLHIEKIYKEIVSGETIAARPEIQNLLTDIDTGEYAGVLVVEIERLARGDTQDQGYIASAFKDSSTKIITPTKVYDPSNEFDEEYFEFGLFMSRREYKTINRRIQRGRLASVQEGKYIGSTAPYGYDRIKLHGKGYTLEINENEASTVRLIFDLYINGKDIIDGTKKPLGMYLISLELDRLGIKPRIAANWSRASIKDILTNPTYIGKIRWSYRKVVKNTEQKDIRYINENCIVVDGLHPAIIDEDIFNKANKMLQENIHVSVQSDVSLKNPLTGLIYCARCGRLMTRAASNTKVNYPVLKCPNAYCSNISAPLSMVEDKLLIALKDWLDNYKLFWKIENKTNSQGESIVQKQNVITRLTKELNTLNKQLSKTYDLLEQEVYTLDIFNNRSTQLRESITTAEHNLEEANAAYAAAKEEKDLKVTFIPRAEKIIETYATVTDPAIRNTMLKEILERAEYNKTERNKKNMGSVANFTLALSPRIKPIP